MDICALSKPPQQKNQYNHMYIYIIIIYTGRVKYIIRITIIIII